MNSNKKQKRSYKWRQWSIGIGVLLILGAILLYSLSKSKVSGDMIIATVNGHDITYEEFMQYASKHRANVRSYFMEQYQATDSKDFWEKNFNGEIPIEKLRQATLEELIRVKVEQSEMMTLGIIKDGDFATLLKELEKENEQRLKAIEAGKIIYGPRQYTLRVYIDYVHGERVASLMGKLSKDVLMISQEESLTFYSQNKDQFKSQDVIKVEALKITIDREDLEARSEGLKDLVANAKEGLDFVKIQQKYKEQNAISIAKEEYLLDQSTSNEKDTNLSTLQWYAKDMSIGETSDIIPSNDAFYLIKILDKKDGGYLGYEEVKEYIQSVLLRQNYKAYIQSKIETAALEIKEKNLKKFK